MGVKSTYDVTREFALEAIQKRLPELSDKQLANVLELAIHSYYHNFSIVDESVIHSQSEKYGWEYNFLVDVDDLPEETEYV